MGIFSEIEEAAADAAGAVARIAEGMIRRAGVSLVNNSRKQSELQVKMLDDEPEPAELWQQYGFTSSPPVDAEAIVIRVGGVAEHQIAIATAKRDSRPTLSAGEVKIYVEGGPLIHITGSQIRLGDGATKAVAREGDQTLSNITIDAAFWTWVNAVAAATMTTAPTTLTSEIDQGSSVVKAVD